MSKYQAYPEYKDSGVEWLDEVPTHWSTVAIKYMALSKNSLFLDGDWIESKDISDSGIRYLTTGNVGEGKYKEQGESFISDEKFKQLNCTEVFQNDILISRLNNPIGRSCVVPDLGRRVVTSVDNVIFRPDVEYCKGYVVYLFSSKDYFQHTSNLSRGATMQRISRGLLGNIRVAVPLIHEQQKIVNFLDHETAKIDTLIDKQQQLIKLLKEKRQAVISHAVTKGLNPDAPMKDSGVEWLGEVPEHWRVIQLRHLFNSMEQGKSPECEARTVEGDEWGVLKTGCVNGGIFRPREHKALPIHIPPHTKYEVKAGDLLMSRASGSRDLIGAVAFVAVTQPKLLLSDKVFRLIPKTGVHPQYVAMLMGAQSVRLQVELSINGAEGLANNITKESIKSFVVAIPAQDEQVAISAHLSVQSMKFSILEDKLAEGLGLLLERRTALISAAVTGKIDVRNWQPNTQQACKEASY